MHWCATALEAVGISGPILFSQTPAEILDVPTHRIAYLYLRQMIVYYLAHGGVLQLSSKPSGILNWQPPEAHDLELEIDDKMPDMVPEYVPLVNLI